jgi:hypothetical protein
MSAAGQYAHFGQIGAAALQMVGAARGIHISKEEGEKAILFCILFKRLIQWRIGNVVDVIADNFLRKS